MSARPGRVIHDIRIDLSHPRNNDARESVRFFELETEIREALRKSESR
jgi:NitT/TauT family transport system ATP-binding protein